jgi:septal ring factor EnvC (AmiA/AmiB activator)
MKLWIGLGALGLATALAAQTDPRARLALARAEAQQARQRSAALQANAKASVDMAERARAEQAAVAGRIQVAEADIAAAEARLALIDRLRRAQERRLAARQQPIVRLTGALQSMARLPSAAVLVQPGSLDDLVRVRALLATLEPRVRAQAAGLRGEVAHVRRLGVAARLNVAGLQAARTRLAAERRRLAGVEAAQRWRAMQSAAAAQLEAARAAQIAESSRDLESFVGELDEDATMRARLASLPGPMPRPQRLSTSLPGKEVPLPVAGPRFRMPAIGPVVRGFGEASSSGLRSRGIGIGARPGAIVVAPAAGRVSFAGLFRGYGAIAILDHGGGYTSLITGLDSNSARVGDAVRQGSPIGRTGANGISIELRRDGRPVDLSQFVA